MAKHRQAKGGLCGRYSSPKVRYTRLAVANFDRSVLQAKLPDEIVDVFKCPYCGTWHVGKR